MNGMRRDRRKSQDMQPGSSHLSELMSALTLRQTHSATAFFASLVNSLQMICL